MLDYVFEAMDARRLGLAPHYLFLYAAVRGLGARSVLEFGAGLSTRVILDAMAGVSVSGQLVTLSTDDPVDLAERFGLRWDENNRWQHLQGRSTERLSSTPDASAEFQCEVHTLDVQHARIAAVQVTGLPSLDLVLHDGAHDFDTVERDLRAVLPHVRRFGLVLVHDTEHSVHGPAMRRAVDAALAGSAVRCSRVTLPYGFGLTVLRVEDERAPAPDLERLRASDKLEAAGHTAPWSKLWETLRQWDE